MDNVIVFFGKPIAGLSSTGGAAITESVARREIIPKRVVHRLRVVVSVDPQTPTILRKLSAFLELPGGIDGSGGGIDLICVAELANPIDATIQTFHAHITALKTQLISNVEETINFRDAF